MASQAPRVVGFFMALLLASAAESAATTVKLTFTGFGSYESPTAASNISVNMPLRFRGTFTYDDAIPDSDSRAQFGQYAVGGTLELSWFDGFVCNFNCPGGGAPNTFYDLGGTNHQHHISMTGIGLMTYNSPPVPNDGDYWGTPFVTVNGAQSQLMSSIFFVLRDFADPAMSPLTSDALVIPVLSAFSDSFIRASRQERVCDPSVYAPCASQFQSQLSWRGQFATLTVETVPEPSSLLSVAAGLVAVVALSAARSTPQ